MNCWDRNTSLKFWAYFLTVCFDFWKGYKIHVFSPTRPKFCMYPLNLLQIKAQTRKLRKAIILFSKVGKNKQIRKMPITLVLTLLTSPFWAPFVSLGCPDNISKNWDDIFSVFKIRKNDPLMSDFSFFLLCKLSKPCKLVMEMSLNGLLWYTVRL